MKHKILGVVALLCAMLFAACSDLLEDLTPKETSSVESETMTDTDLYVHVLEISGDFTLEIEQSGTKLRFTALDTEPGANLVWKVYKGLEDTVYTQSGSDTSFDFDTGDLEPGKYTLLVTSGTRSATAVFTVNTTVTVPVNLKTGDDINSILVQLCPGELCTKFARSDTNNEEATWYLDTEEKYIPVWVDGTEVYYYVPDGCTPVMNEDSSGMFAYCSGLTSLEVTGFDTSKVTNMESMFEGCSGLTSLDVTGFDTSNVTNMERMFFCCLGLASLDVTGFNTSKVEHMESMFEDCSGLTSLDLSKFDTGNVTNMERMFGSCSGLNSLDVTGFDTSKVTDMSHMFALCSGLASLDVSKFDTSNVTNMSHMFAFCSGLASLDLTGFDTSKVSNMWSMFEDCSGLTSLDVSKFNTSNVTDMSRMFEYCSGLTSLDLSSFDTSKVSDMWGMFSECKGLTTIYASDKFVTTSLPDGNNYKGKCFFKCSKLVGGAGTTYDSSRESADYARIDGGTDAPGYFTQKAKCPEGFVKVTGIEIEGNETWTPSSKVFISGRKLTIPDLYVCDHEVTRGEFNALMGEDPSTAKAYDKDGIELTGDAVLNNPVNYVTWYAAIAYCNKLSVKEDLTPAYTVSGIDWENLAYSSIPTSSNDTWNAAICNFEANGYRLPTEAEWEWLARGGEDYDYAGSSDIDKVAWYKGNTSNNGSRDIKTKAANGYGLYDMSGNVWEWCWDWYADPITTGTVAAGSSSGSSRVQRGGSWYLNVNSCRVALRDFALPDYRTQGYGFRVVRSAQ